MKPDLVLSRRNLLTLHAKLDRNKMAGAEESACTLLLPLEEDSTLGDESGHREDLCVKAVEDEVKYADRPAGKVMDAPGTD
jgi:hypothetical protein